jgi:hypothetical protein
MVSCIAQVGGSLTLHAIGAVGDVVGSIKTLDSVHISNSYRICIEEPR